MKVILRTDILKLGKSGDVVEVANGYARNFLIPQGKAFLATKTYRHVFEELRKNLIRKEEKIIQEKQKICDAMEKKVFLFPCKVGEKDQMFGSVTSLDIEKKLINEGFEVDKKDLKLQGSLSKLGSYEVSLRLHPRVTATIKIELIPTK